MAEDNLTQFKTEGQPAFQVENKEKENSAASSAGEQTDGDQTQSQEGEQNSGANKDGADRGKGFLEDPRWQQREGVWKDRFNEQERRHAETVDQLRKDFFSKIEEVQRGSSRNTEEVPEWFGGDEKHWSQYGEHTKSIVASAVEQALKQFSSRTDEEQKRIDDATIFLQAEADSIETDKSLNPQGLKLDRNKLLKTALDNDIVDSKGRWNYRAAFKIMKPSEIFAAKGALNERKQIAGATTENNRAEPRSPNIVTSKDFANPSNRPW